MCFLQECHLKNTEDIKRFSKDWKAGASVWSIGNVHSDGVGIIFKDTGFVIEEEINIIPGRLVYVDGRLNNNKLRLVNVYAPALKGERLDFFKHLPNVLCTNRIVIMGGDFNTYLEGEYDFTAQYLKNVLGDYNLADIYRRHNKKRYRAYMEKLKRSKQKTRLSVYIQDHPKFELLHISKLVFRS